MAQYPANDDNVGTPETSCDVETAQTRMAKVFRGAERTFSRDRSRRWHWTNWLAGNYVVRVRRVEAYQRVGGVEIAGDTRGLRSDGLDCFLQHS